MIGQECGLFLPFVSSPVGEDLKLWGKGKEAGYGPTVLSFGCSIL